MCDVSSFEVEGVHGWKRAGWSHGHAYTRPVEVEWQEKVRQAWRDAGAQKFSGTVIVHIVAYKLHDYTKPDIDNIAKSILDALTGYAWADDNAVTGLNVEKCSRDKRDPDMTYITILGEVTDDAELV